MSSAPAPLSDEERELARNRRTLYLMVGGAASLLLPLLGVAYLKFMDQPPPQHSGPTVAFEHRGVDGTQLMKLSPAATPAPAMSGAPLAQVPQLAPREGSPAPIQSEGGGADAGGSLGFIRGGGDYYHDKGAAAPAPAQAAPAPQQAAAPAPAPKPAPAVAQAKTKAAPKPFSMPHLHTINSGSYGSFADKPGRGGAGGGQTLTPDQIRALQAAQAQQQQQQSGFAMPPLGGRAGGGAQAPAGAAPGAAAGAAPGGQPDMSALLKNLPPGTDVNALLQSLPQNRKGGQ